MKPNICSYPEYFQELGIEEENYILGMCRFVPEKRLDDLVKAFVQAKKILISRIGAKNTKKDIEDIKLVLAGDTDFEDDYSVGLKKLARKNGVILTGFVRGQKKHSLLSHARAYSLPSSHEGLPIALLEAMSYSLPVVVSDIPANLEVGLPEKDYFHLGNINQLAEKLEVLIKAPLNRIPMFIWDK